MYLHANAKLGLAGRLALVRAIEEGLSLKAAAAAFSVSPATAHRWWHRWLEAGEEARRTLSCLFDRSSRPHRSPRQLAPELAGGDLRLPPRDRLGAAAGRRRDRLRALDGLEGAAAGRASRGRRGRRKEPANRYEWPCPGDLLHMDTSRYARFLRPGHRVTGDRSQRSRDWMQPETRVGYDYAHAIVDDHSRLAYVELHDDEKAATVTGFVERALAFFAEHGIAAQAADDRQRLQLRQEPLAARAARPPRHPPPHHQALPATHQRQGRALPPDDGTRMGLRARLPLTSTPQRTPCHTGSTTTTGDDHTAHSETDHRSAAFTTSVGRTARRSPPPGRHCFHRSSSSSACPAGSTS